MAGDISNATKIRRAGRREQEFMKARGGIGPRVTGRGVRNFGGDVAAAKAAAAAGNRRATQLNPRTNRRPTKRRARKRR